MSLPRIISYVVAVAISCAASRADDWPQFRGPQRDGVSHETGLLKQWPAGGPKLAWSISSLGVGYSGPAVVGDRLYICCGREDAEYVVALDLKDRSQPKELWATKIGPIFTWDGNEWNRGPNATPTIDGKLLFALGGSGELLCVETASGKEVWRKNLPRDLGGEVNPIGGGAAEPTPLGWGYAAAPLVDGAQLICVPGGKQGLLAALDKKSGKVLWQSSKVTDQAPYSSPIAAEVAGVRQYIQVSNAGIVGIAPWDGKPLWTYRRQPAYDDVVIATPIVHDDRIFASVGFGQGCDLIKIIRNANALEVEQQFSNKTVQSRDGGLVLVGDHVYGYAENRGWVCVEFKTGKFAWSNKKTLGRGSITCADGNLYCAAELGGAVALVEATPTAWTETGRLTLPKQSANRRPRGGVWTHPVIAGGRLYLRDQEMLYCYELKP